MLKIIAFSLYRPASLPANERKYEVGAVRNVELAARLYEGWQCWFYADGPRPELAAMGAKVIDCGHSLDHRGMSWRLRAASEPDLEAVIFRDCDSRLNACEKAAVEEWLASDCKAHSLHAHRHHVIHPLLGGMWGVRGGVFGDMAEVLKGYYGGRQSVEWIDDLKFLEYCVYPRVAQSCLHHSTVPVKWTYKPFPAHETIEGFVGQQLTADETRIWPE